jgi:hypothetical protein
VNPGGGAGWDESPLDIQIPDDARELDRDVLAYHRELRAKRRRSRLRRLAGPLAGHGAIMPLLASILAVCLVAGAMLSVATFSPGTAPSVQPPSPTLAASSSPPFSSSPPVKSRTTPATPATPASSSAAVAHPSTSTTAAGGRASHSASPSASPSRPSPSGRVSVAATP